MADWHVIGTNDTYKYNDEVIKTSHSLNQSINSVVSFVLFYTGTKYEIHYTFYTIM